MCGTKERFTFWAGGSRTVRASNHTPHNDRQFKTYELFSSGVFHLIFSVNNWGLTETTEIDTWDQRGCPCPVVPLGGKSTRRRGHLKPEVVVKWPVSSHVRKRKHHHNPRKKPEGPNPEMRTVTVLRSSLLEWSTSMRMLKPSLSEWFQVQRESFLTFWTEWPGTHLQKERRGTWVQIPSEHCNLQISGPQHQSQWPSRQLLGLNGEEETALLFSSLHLNLIIKWALCKPCFQNCSLHGLTVYLELFSH